MGLDSRKSQISSLYSGGMPWSAHLACQHRADVVFDEGFFSLLVFELAVYRLAPKGVVHVVELVLHRFLDFLEQAPSPLSARVLLLCGYPLGYFRTGSGSL